MKATVHHEFMGDWVMDLVKVGAEVQLLLPALIQASDQSSGFSDLSEI